MKYAVIFIGHLRNNYQQCFNNIKIQLLNNLPNYEIFLHTWDQISLTNKNHVSNEIIENIYSTKNYLIEKHHNDLIKFIKFDYKSINFQMYSLYRIYQEFENKLRDFDYIIKIRPDIKFRIPIFLKLNDRINFYQTNLGGGLDVVFYGKRELIMETLQIAKKIDNSKNNFKKPEQVYLDYWMKNNIKFLKLDKKFLKVISIIR